MNEKLLFENKFIELLTDSNHIYLAIGIFCLLYIIRKVKYINIIFEDKYSWTIPIINLILSFIGIFILKMTPSVSVGQKICIVFVITATTSYVYKLTKPILWAIAKKIFGDAANNVEP